jgi:AraC-like DNA-binding protein
MPVSEVAAAAHATVRTLERKFKQSSGHTVKDVSGLMRFEQVRNRLWHAPQTSLAALAQELGYTDQSHLSREFKRYSGTTPAAFARKAREASKDFVAFVQAPAGAKPRLRGMNTSHQVIIAGAGPVGLLLACELALAKCPVLLEKAADPHSPLKQLPFGIRGLNAPSIEALHRRGLLDEMEVPRRLQNPLPASAPDRPAISPAFPSNTRTSIPPAGRKVCHTACCPEMGELEAVLTRRALSLGVEIRRGAAITEVAQDDSGVTVRARAGASRACCLAGRLRRRAQRGAQAGRL